MKLPSLTFALLAAAAAFAAPVRAQEAPAPTESVDIMKHITDAHELEVPFVGEVALPRWAPVHVGKLVVDLSPTKHVVMMLLAAFLVLVTMSVAASGAVRQTREHGHTRGFAGAIETIVVFVRNEVVMPNVGAHGEGFAPFVLTLFFFILYANLLGLIPYLSTATGNIAVTLTLATITFFVIEGASIKTLGKDYIWTILYWPHDMSLPLKLIMTPIEIISKFTKPFALTIRLFANMTAGHIVLLAFISLIFTFHSWLIVVAPVGMGVALSMLELFVAFLQAFIFSLLASVFIGLARSGAH